MYMYGTLIEAS